MRYLLVVALVLGCRSTPAEQDAAVSPGSDARDAAASSPDATPVSYPGLVGYWRFDEGRGSTVVDSSPSGNRGSLKGGALLAAGGFPRAKFPNAGSLALDGVDGSVVLDAKALPAINGAKTISLWMTTLALSTGVHDLIALTNPTAMCGLQLGVKDGRLAAWGWGGAELVGVTALRPGWHHVVYTFDGARHTLIVDGAVSPATSTPPQSCAVTQASIGNAPSGMEPFQGSIDDVRIYDRVLGEGELAVLLRGDEPAITGPSDGGLQPPVDAAVVREAGPVTDAGVTGPLAVNLVGYWPLNEGMGTTTADLSGSGNAGTLAGVAAWTPDGFPGAKFMNPFSLTLAGNGDQVNVGVNRLPAVDQSLSVSLWFNYAAPPMSGNRTFFSFTNRAEVCGIQIGTRGTNLSVWMWGGVVHVAMPAPPPGWHHLVYTFDGTTHAVYIDGAAPVTSTTSPQSCFPTDAIIGNYQGGREFFIGQIDDVRMWGERALGAADVAALFAGEQ